MVSSSLISFTYHNVVMKVKKPHMWEVNKVVYNICWLLKPATFGSSRQSCDLFMWWPSLGEKLKFRVFPTSAQAKVEGSDQTDKSQHKQPLNLSDSETLCFHNWSRGKMDEEINHRVQKANQIYYQLVNTMVGNKELKEDKKYGYIGQYFYHPYCMELKVWQF